MTGQKRFRCLEHECPFVVESASDEELVESVQKHMASAHQSIEDEEIILANTEERSTTHD